MANQGFGATGNAGNDDFETLARQYWSRWGEMLRGAGSVPGTPFGSAGGVGYPGASPAAVPGWNEAVAWWSQMAGGNGQPADDAVRRFGGQANGWYAQLQQLAAQFAGQDASAADIVAGWKRALEGNGGNPFADALRGMQNPGQQNFDQWLAQVSPWLEQLRHDGQAWLGLPAFGFTREHQERWQRLAQAQLDYQQQGQAFQALMAEAAQDAFRRFEDKLAERSEPGRQLQSARALFDLWIDAAEEAYADVALSPRFREAYGAMTNAQMRLRSAVQREVEQACEALGVPTRGEVDAAHRKIVQLEREIGRLRDLVAGEGTVGDHPRTQGAGPGTPVRTAIKRGKARAASEAGERVAPAKSASQASGRATSTQAPSKKTVSKPPAKPARTPTKKATGASKSAPRKAR